jgi:NAD(P)H-dependent FMN reductase
MNQYQIAVLVGSLRRESHNRALASAMAALAPKAFAFKQILACSRMRLITARGPMVKPFGPASPQV